MSEEKQPPALGAKIKIGSKVCKVHCDCKRIRDALEVWLRRHVRETIDAQLASKEIGKEEHAAQRAIADAEIRGQRYVYGTENFQLARAGTDEGVKRDLFERIKLDDQSITFEEVEAWVDANKWIAAHAVMFEADGLGQAPK